MWRIFNGFVFNFFKKQSRVSITAINIRWQGSTHSLSGAVVKGKTAEIKIPFTNKPQKDYGFLKTQKSTPIKIGKLEVKSPFKFLSVDPSLPVSIEEGQKVVFNLSVEVPDCSYEGPMGIELAPVENPLVHLELPKIVVNTLNGRVELKDHPLIMDVQKGQILKQTINMQKVLGLEGEVKGMSVKPPFTFVSSDPKVPFKIDPKQGYLIFIYVQAPQQNYGGPLEIDLQ